MGGSIAGAQESPAVSRDEPAIVDPDVYVPALLTHLSNTLTNNASIFYRQHFGVGLTDWRIMYRLASEPWITAHRICELSALDKAVVSRSIAWMESRGLVLIQGDAKDARRRLLALSPAGLDLHNRITVVALERERNFLAALSADEVAETIRLLTKLVDNLGAFSKPVAIPPEAVAPDETAPPTSPRRPIKPR
ncbi:MAG: MarR family transcriptional regulator [Methylobacterium sp.]|jgi:DNA-binding MarR family transcriptional regulator|nr:MAG: MarR family transcriptional regulator [Methylobacterium sp.]